MNERGSIAETYMFNKGSKKDIRRSTVVTKMPTRVRSKVGNNLQKRKSTTQSFQSDSIDSRESEDSKDLESSFDNDKAE